MRRAITSVLVSVLVAALSPLAAHASGASVAQEETGSVLLPGPGPNGETTGGCWTGWARRSWIVSGGATAGPFGSMFEIDKTTWDGKFKRPEAPPVPKISTSLSMPILGRSTLRTQRCRGESSRPVPTSRERPAGRQEPSPAPRPWPSSASPSGLGRTRNGHMTPLPRPKRRRDNRTNRVLRYIATDCVAPARGLMLPTTTVVAVQAPLGP
jgi:hypothetical protein